MSAAIGSVRALYDGALLPDQQALTLRNAHRLFPTRIVARAPLTQPLPHSALAWPAIACDSQLGRVDLFDYLALNRVGALLVIKDGQVRFEHYALGGGAESRWTSMSIVKSISATLVGAALHDGLIGSLDEPVTHYVAALKGSAYDGVTLRQLLTMTSGVAWNETYTDPESDRRRMLEAQIGQRPGAIIERMAGLARAHAPGKVFNYSTGETHVVGAVLRNAVAAPVAHYLSQRIWSPMGMEANAHWWLESPDGLEVGGSGLGARARDFARFGLFMLGDGVAGGRRVLPQGFAAAAGSDQLGPGNAVPYGYMWWPLPQSAGAVHRGAYQAIGIFGQSLYIHPQDRVVIAQFAALPKPKGIAPIATEAFFGAIVAALRT